MNITASRYQTDGSKTGLDENLLKLKIVTFSSLSIPIREQITEAADKAVGL